MGRDDRGVPVGGGGIVEGVSSNCCNLLKLLLLGLKRFPSISSSFLDRCGW